MRDSDEAAPLVDRMAPEHLELRCADPEALLPQVRHAGAIFLGHHTPEAIGDYVAGPNHVLPTARTARFASGLSVFDFLKRTTILACDRASFRSWRRRRRARAKPKGWRRMRWRSSVAAPTWTGLPS